MGLFTIRPFNNYRDDILQNVYNEVIRSETPEDTYKTMIETHQYGEIGVDLQKMKALPMGNKIHVYIPCTGDLAFFDLQVSMNADPLPNSRIVKDDSSGLTYIQLTYDSQQGERTIVTAVEAARNTLKQCVMWMNEGIHRINAQVKEAAQNALETRQRQLEETKRLANLINQSF